MGAQPDIWKLDSQDRDFFKEKLTRAAKWLLGDGADYKIHIVGTRKISDSGNY